METKEQNFFRSNPERSVIVALDDREDGLLFGAVELRGGEELWLDYELEFSQDSCVVSLFRGAEDVPVLEYHACLAASGHHDAARQAVDLLEPWPARAGGGRRAVVSGEDHRQAPPRKSL